MAARRGGRCQVAAVGDIDLLAHQVEPAHLLADRVLDLQTRVDLQEVHLSMRGHHELARAQTDVVDLVEQAARIRLQLVDDLVRQERSGGLLDELLVAPLHRAVTRRVHGEVAETVAAALGLHVAGLVDELLDEVLVQVAALHRVMVHVEATHLVIVVHDGDASAATAVGALHHHRVAVRVREVQQRAQLAHRLADARHRRHLRGLRHATRGDLVAEVDQRLRMRSHPDRARFLDLVGEARHLGEESVAGVHGVRAGPVQDADQQVLVEVCARVCVTRQQVRLVGQLDVLGVAVLFGVHRHRGNPHLPGGSHHAQRDLAAVGDEYFFDDISHIFHYRRMRASAESSFRQKRRRYFVERRQTAT